MEEERSPEESHGITFLQSASCTQLFVTASSSSVLLFEQPVLSGQCQVLLTPNGLDLPLLREGDKVVSRKEIIQK